MSYVFDIGTLHAIARLGVGKAHDEMVKSWLKRPPEPTQPM